MESAVSYTELIIALISLGSGVVGSWIHMRINVSSITQKVEYLEKEIQDEKEANKENHTEMNKKVDKIFSMINEIKIMIAEIKIK